MSDQGVWRKSTYSGANTNCVEIADLPGGAAVRDSRHPEVAQLRFAADEWAAFLTEVRAERL